MQLPRGTFREIQKNKNTHDILSELERGRFSGICSISNRESVCTLVLKSGKCILAEFGSSKGDAAFESLLKAFTGESVDAALSTLDEPQIQLSLEFNKPERILKSAHIQRPSEKISVNPPAKHAAPHTPVKKPAPVPRTNLSPALSPPNEEIATLVARSPEHTAHHLAGPKSPVTVPPASIRSANSPIHKHPEIPEKNLEKTDFENDLDILDSMNLDQVTDKIRDDCKTMVKNLRLDHLMEKD